MSKPRVMVADSSSLTVLGAQSVLSSAHEVVICTAADELTALLSPQAGQSPDVILIGDSFDPSRDPIGMVEHVRAIASAARIVVLGGRRDGLIIQDLFAVGMSGYLYLGDDLVECLPYAVEWVLRNRPYLSPTANAEYLIALQTGERPWKLDGEARSVLRLLAQGYTVGQIALQLNLAPRRVYWVRQKLRNRFGAATNEHLIQRAIEEGFGSFAV